VGSNATISSLDKTDACPFRAHNPACTVHLQQVTSRERAEVSRWFPHQKAAEGDAAFGTASEAVLAQPIRSSSEGGFMWGYSCLLHSASSVQLEACELQRLLRARTNAPVDRIRIDAHRSLRTVRASVLTRPLATASRSCCAMGRPSTLKKGSGARVGGAVDKRGVKMGIA
jgi:hypothetical protein